jgi:hypothetical protein
MQRQMRLIGVSCVVVLVLSSGMANAQQRRGGRFGRGASALSVAAVPQVAKELKLTEEQAALAKKLATEDRKQRQELFQGFRDLTQEQRRERFQKSTEQRQAKEKQLAESLGAEKMKRIRQLSLQTRGVVSAFFDRQTGEKLKISDDQRSKAREEIGGMREEFTAARNNAEARAKLVTKMNETLAEILNDDQKASWKEMLGKPAGKELLAAIRAATTRRRRSSN